MSCFVKWLTWEFLVIINSKPSLQDLDEQIEEQVMFFECICFGV